MPPGTANHAGGKCMDPGECLPLAIDLGSTRIKVLAHPPGAGDPVYLHAPAPHSAPGIIDTEAYLKEAVKLLHDVLEHSQGSLYERRACLAVTGQRASMAAWAPGGLEASPTLTWRRRPSRRILERVERGDSSGLLSLFLQPTSGLLRAEELKPLLGRPGARLGGLEALFVERVFGEPLTDPSFAVAYGALDPFTLGWVGEILQFLGLDSSALPRLVETRPPEPPVASLDGWRLELRALVSDQAASLAEACSQPGCTKVTLGTGFFLDQHTGGEVRGDPGRGVLPLVAWRAWGRTVYMAEYFLHHGGESMDMLRTMLPLGGGENLESQLQESGPLPLVLPSLTYLSSEFRRGYEGMCIEALKPSHTPGAILRGLRASLAVLLARGLDALERSTGNRASTIWANGGWANDRSLLVYIATALGRNLQVGEKPEWASLIGAMALGLAGGPGELPRLLEALGGGRRMVGVEPVGNLWLPSWEQLGAMVERCP